MNTTKVSVVVSTYNRPVKLLRAIRSVQSQTYKNWEVSVVGDGCSDETAQAISKLNDPRVLYYNLPKNHGPSDMGSTAKSTAIQNSSGEYVSYLDDDDWYLPEHLEKSVAYLDSNKETDMVYACSEVYKFLDPRRFKVRDREYDKHHLEKHPFINTSEIVHRRSMLDKLSDGLWNPVGYLNDFDFTRRASRVANIVHLKHIAASQHYNHGYLLNMEIKRHIRSGGSVPKISLIVGVRDRTKYFIEVLKSLENQTANKRDFEVIVVDQGHGTESLKHCGMFSGMIRHIALNNNDAYHRGWVCNVGAKQSLSDLFCFVDCDSPFVPTFVDKALEVMEEQDDENYLFRVRGKCLKESDIEDFFNGNISLDKAYQISPLNPTATALGCGTCVSRTPFFSIKGFDENFDKGWGGEDVDLFERLVASGCKVVEFPEAMHVHLWHETGSHERIHRGDNYWYYKNMKKLNRKNINEYIFRNRNISWGEFPREIYE